MRLVTLNGGPNFDDAVGACRTNSQQMPPPFPFFSSTHGTPPLRPTAFRPLASSCVTGIVNPKPFQRPARYPQLSKKAVDTTPATCLKSHTLPVMGLAAVSQSPIFDGLPTPDDSPRKTLSKPAAHSSLSQRKLDQELVDKFLRERGYCSDGTLEKSSGLGMTLEEKEQKKEKKKAWRRRRRLSHENRKNSSKPVNDVGEKIVELSVNESSMDDLLSECGPNVGIATRTDPVRNNPSHQDPLKNERREKVREAAELTKLEAKIGALEKLRKLRSNPQKFQSGRDCNKIKNSLDDLVADSVFESRIEKLGYWIEKRRNMMKSAKNDVDT